MASIKYRYEPPVSEKAPSIPPLSSSSTSNGSSPSTSPKPGSEDFSKPRQPGTADNFVRLVWAKLEVVCLYMWVLIQAVLLVAGLTVLHFSTFSVMICYLVNGFIKGRRELLPHKK